jgi:uncharacterized LabA/DUF88 family protein
MDSASWLVDVGYVVKASEGKFRLDYVATHRLLEERYGRTRTFLFNGYDLAYGIPEGLQKFYGAMEHYGMVVRLQPMQSDLPGKNRQRRVDVDLAAHLVWQASLGDVTTLVLTTGDQDLLPAVEVARERCGKRVLLYTYERNVHTDLVASVDEWRLFEDDQDRVAR